MNPSSRKSSYSREANLVWTSIARINDDPKLAYVLQKSGSLLLESAEESFSRAALRDSDFDDVSQEVQRSLSYGRYKRRQRLSRPRYQVPPVGTCASVSVAIPVTPSSRQKSNTVLAASGKIWLSREEWQRGKTFSDWQRRSPLRSEVERAFESQPRSRPGSSSVPGAFTWLKAGDDDTTTGSLGPI